MIRRATRLERLIMVFTTATMMALTKGFLISSLRKPSPPFSTPNLPVSDSTSWLRYRSIQLNAIENNPTGDNHESISWLSLSERTKGLAVLLTVPFAWGTYVPVVRYLYEVQPAVPGFVFSACYYAVASITTLGIVALSNTRQRKVPGEGRNTIVTNGTDKIDDDDNGDMRISPSSSFPILGGCELGVYLFLGNCLQVIALKEVPSDRAGFLVQLTTVMVPVFEALFAGNLLAISPRTWFSCLLAFGGICVMNLDGALGGQGLASILMAFTSFTKGDVLILAAAVCYTLHVVRLGRYARETTPMELAASKATVETILSLSLVLGLMAFAGTASETSGLQGFMVEAGNEINFFFSTISRSFATGSVPQSAIISAACATLWTGLVTCAYTIFAQSFGQKRVGPTDANLIYSFQPICTALFAFLLLGETMGPAGVIGGALIGASVYLVTVTGDNDSIVGDGVDPDDDESRDFTEVKKADRIPYKRHAVAKQISPASKM